MKTRPKLAVCALIFVVGGILCVFFSTALHGILSRQTSTLVLTPFTKCVSSILSDRQHLHLFVCMQGFVLIMAVLFFLMNLRPYQSELNEITPEIRTPRAVGQYQHGSSRWLKESEKDKAFASFVLDPADPMIRELIRTGYDDLDFMKPKRSDSV